jgi:hypothetical protein
VLEAAAVGGEKEEEVAAWKKKASVCTICVSSVGGM